ncbi:MAG: shikimate kinase [Deltaproteobacteria bacterium]|nr:shikimate kinase [Deltaproteobacteria bacterium]MBI4374360.1 shikimate kinase [Deltaproteobacteria bacterium]
MTTRIKTRIILTGFMGTGKTVVGQALAVKLKHNFLDTDQMIEKKTGRKIEEIFEKEGEAIFRRMEKKMVRKALSGERLVVATGGGAVIDPENLELMKRRGVLIALTTSPGEILERMQKLDNRPLLRGEDKMGKIKKLLSKRSPFYQQADQIIDCSGKGVIAIVEEIVKRLNENINR